LKGDTINLTCCQCGQRFVFTRAEQELYAAKGLTFPTHCRECSSVKQRQLGQVKCSHCGSDLDAEAVAYCDSCWDNVRLELEHKMRKRQQAVSKEHTKLLVTESRRAEVEELLRQKEMTIEEMNMRISSLTEDLEKVQQFHSAVGWWLQPVLDEIKERLYSVEQSQNKTNERMLQLVERMHELYGNAGLMEIFKRGLKQQPGRIPRPHEA